MFGDSESLDHLCSTEINSLGQMERLRNLIFEVVIHARSFVLRYTLLPLIHLRNLPTRTRHIRRLIVSLLDEPGKPETDALPTSTHIVRCRLVPRAECQIRSLDFPHVLGLEPDVGLI